ncbi:site-2 protease family protein [Halogranum rubrum]|uniref:Membrane-associated zn-dependent protease n=1 Tax=Halogranum salarium B-1 TaxID=1210908 RepID=J2ZC08_9EURY|nr:site-2 protease family protein [Halogranum salarium]EJN58190.1 membrane-associated zn-dependent protease [Halogranum salarium B-1]
MNPLLWVLAGVLLYSVVAVSLQSRGLIPDSVRIQGPLTTIHTKRGRAFLNWLARPKRFWRAWSNVGVGVALVVMVGSFFLFLQAAIQTVQSPQPTAINQPRNFLVIPGVNDFLPLSMAPEIVFGLLVGLVVHEGGHGLLCRVEDIDIESMGVVLLTILPIGAFVEPNEESQRKTNRGARTRMFAAGVTNNFVVTIIAFALLFGPVVGAIGVAPGVAVAGSYDGSPAGQAGIGGGDRIVGVAGQSVDNQSTFDTAWDASEGESVQLSVAGSDGDTREVSVERSLVVVGTIGGNPANLTLQQGQDPIEIRAVNGTAVSTQAEFREAVGTDTFARLDTSRGERVVPVGAYVTGTQEGRPMYDAMEQNGDDPNESFIITNIGGERITSADDLSRVLDGYSGGDTVDVDAYVDGEMQSYTLTFDSDLDEAFLGVNLFSGTSGLSVTDLGIQSYPASTYLALLGGDTDANALSGPLSSTIDTFRGLAFVALILPLASVFGLPYNFPGFTPEVMNFFVVEGPLSFLGGGVFLAANLLFWTAWINLQLGLFNCIPGYPLDGGRIMRTSVEAIVSRLPISDPYPVVRTITTSIGVTMLAALVLMVFGPQLLA